MESYGLILKNAREEKNLTYEDVEREICIPKQSLMALESEDTSAFQGETYFKGFLKSYCDHLGVDNNAVLKLYEAKKIQESPVPTELLAKSKPKFLIPLIIVSVLAVLAGVGAYLYFGVFKIPEKQAENARVIAENAKVHVYEFDSSTLTKRLYVGDQILVPDPSAEGENITLTVKDTLGVLNVSTPAGNQILTLSEERELDIDGDGKAEIILYLSDISKTDSSRGAEVRMLLKDSSTVISRVDVNEIPLESSATVGSAQTVLVEDTRAYPFTVQVSFRGACLFRYRIDRQDKIENYYSTGEQITVTASNMARVWMSNGNTLSVSVIANGVTYPLEIGKAGQVRVQEIRWVRDTDGKYRLVVIELD